MKAMVLCAGLGTRLRPLTNRWPKPAMPLLGGPLFRYSLATLQHAGITQVGINTHHLPEVMEAVARQESPSLAVAHEAGEIQGTGGGIRGLRDFLRDDDFVVLNGDVLFSVDLAPVIAAHQASGAAATMVLLPMPAGETYAAVELDPDRVVRRIRGKGPGGDKLAPWHFTGVHVMTPAVFDFMAPSGPEDINADVYVRMMEKGLTIRGHVLQPNDVYWSDLGTPQRYAATHRDLLFGQVPLGAFGDKSPIPLSLRERGEGQGEGPPRVGSIVWKHPTAQVDADVKVAGPAWFGAGCIVEAGVRLGAAVSIGPGAKVGQGARLNRVAVLDGAEVAAGAVLQDCIVGPGMIVPTT